VGVFCISFNLRTTSNYRQSRVRHHGECNERRRAVRQEFGS
jgi:hypothetical protein